MIKAVSALRLAVADVERSLDFYKTLGLQVIPGEGPPREVRSNWFRIRLESRNSSRGSTGLRVCMSVDDIENEWLDRYGPIPDRARALLGVARLRAECVRLGVREMSVTKATGSGSMMMPGAMSARITPIDLKTSEEIRLQRLSRTAIWKQKDQLLILPMKPKTDVVEFLLTFLGELFPG